MNKRRYLKIKIGNKSNKNRFLKRTVLKAENKLLKCIIQVINFPMGNLDTIKIFNNSLSLDSPLQYSPEKARGKRIIARKCKFILRLQGWFDIRQSCTIMHQIIMLQERYILSILV